MSSPIAIPRRAPSPAGSDSDATSSSLHSTGLYVPVHKRASSVSSADASPASSWRSLSPVKPPKQQRNGGTKKHPKPAAAKKGPSPNDASKRTRAQIPIAPKIPTQPTTTTTPAAPALPFVYPVSALLALAGAPAALSETQLESVRELNELIPPPAEPTEKEKEKAAARRRRVGRARKNTLTLAHAQIQPASKAVAVDVQTRRARHGPAPANVNVHANAGHGTWGWNQYATPEALASHQHDMEESWRHAQPPVVTISVA